MSDFATLVFHCFACGVIATGNPDLVPSIRARRNHAGKIVVDQAAERQPLCRNCIDRANAQREANGLDPHPVHPDAYEATGPDTFGSGTPDGWHDD